MAGIRLLRVDPRPFAWALAAVVLSAAGGLVAGHSARLAFDIAVVLLAAVVFASRPYASLVAVLLVLAWLPRKEVIPFLLFFAGALALLVRAPRLPGRRVSVPLLLFLLLALPSLTLRPSPDEGIVAPELKLPAVGFPYASTPSVELREWLTLGSVLVVFCLAAWAVRSVKRLDQLVVVVLASSVLPIGIALGQLASGNTYERAGSTLKSLRGPFPHPNYFAFYLVVVLALAVHSFMEARRLNVRVALGLLIAVGIATLFLTYTRSAWIGFMLALLGMGLLRYRRLLVVAVAGLALAAFVAPGAARQAQKRFGDLTSQSEASDTSSWQWRLDQWSAMLPFGFSRPLTGHGWDSYPRLTVDKFGHFDKRFPTVRFPAYGVYSALGFTAHNDYVKDFVELGAPGLLLWVLTLVGLAIVAWRARSVPGAGGIAATMLASVVALMVISASDNVQGYTVVLAYPFAVVGGLAGVTAAQRRTVQEPAAASVVVDGPALRARHAPRDVAPEPGLASGDAPVRLPHTVRGRPRIERARARIRGMFGRRRRMP